MKIAQIACVYPPYKGGMGTSAENFARVFKLAQLEAKTFTIKAGKEESSEDVIRLKAFPGFGNGGVLTRLYWQLKDFDVIYLHYPFFGTAEIVWFLKKFIWKNKKKLVIQYHMDTVLPNLFLKILSLPSNLIFNSLFKEADLIVSASLDYVKNSKLKNIYESSLNAQKKFVEIPFGVDLEKFQPLITKESSKFEILFVGGLDRAHYFKGVDVLLEAVAKISNSNWQLNIIGSGDLEKNYQAKARELNIADKVNFLGNISATDLPNKYQTADVLVLPSINKGEAFGIVLLEAMASGVPVISSDLPGVRGVFENGKQGLVFKTADVADLTEKIEFLMANPEKQQEIAREARSLAEQKYDWKKIGDKLLAELGAL